MDNEPNVVEKKSSRDKSRLYPRYTIDESVKFAEIVHRLGGSRVPLEMVAKETGKTIRHSTFIGRTSSAKQFNLVTLEKSRLSLTALSQRIFYPTSPKDKQAALQEAFASPSLYQEIIENYRGKMLPERESLGNILKHDYQIKANARDVAANNFIQSAENLGLVRNGIFCLNDYNLELPAQEIRIDNDTQDNTSTNQIKDVHSVAVNTIAAIKNADEYNVFPFDGGMELRIPKTKKSLKAIALQFKTAYEELEKFSKFLVEEETENK